MAIDLDADGIREAPIVTSLEKRSLEEIGMAKPRDERESKSVISQVSNEVEKDA